MKILRNSLFVAVLIMAIIYLVAWKSPKYYKVTQPYNTADSIIPFHLYTGQHDRPYIIRTNDLVVFGAQHTRNPNDPELFAMEEAWTELKPTVAMVEGRLGFLLPYFMDPVKTLGEGGLVKALAHRDGVKIYDWDLSKETLANALVPYFSREQVALQQILNPYFSNIRFGKPSNPEQYISEYLKRADYVGLKDSIRTVMDIDRIWKKYFPQGPDWRNTSDETTLPGYLADMMSVSNDLRNRQLVAAVKELVAKGERVFVVCGSSHAYCVATAFR